MNKQIVRYLEGQLSAEALNAGVAPGQSELLEDHAGEQLRRMRRLAFVPGTTTGGFLTGNMSSSYVSEPTSEYGLHPSSSSSDGADASEVSSAQRGEPAADHRRVQRHGRGGGRAELRRARGRRRRDEPAHAPRTRRRVTEVSISRRVLF